MKRVIVFCEENPWVFLIAAGIFAYQSLDSLRTYFRLNVIREATDITKDAADA